jgi:hypothetical protein
MNARVFGAAKLTTHTLCIRVITIVCSLLTALMAFLFAVLSTHMLAAFPFIGTLATPSFKKVTLFVKVFFMVHL